MVLTPIQILGIITALFFGGIIGLIVYMFKDDILTIMRPGDYVVITMNELDNNVRSWLQKKTSDLRFNFNEGYYNMFDTSEVTGEGTKKNFNPVYRNGRVAQFFYNEGNPNPLDFRQVKSESNPQLRKNLMAVDLSNLFNTEKSAGQELMEKYGFYLLIGVVAIVVFILMTKGG